MLLLRNARLFDAASRGLRERSWLLIEGERIAAVGAAGQAPPDAPDARVIDLGGRTLLPGLINLHVHFVLDGSGDTWGRLLVEDDQLLALRGVKIAGDMLRRGITALRDLGAKGPGIIRLRQVIDEGLYPGPRIQAAGHSICMTGGHFRVGGSVEADGVPEIQKVARRQLDMGADLLKFMATSGMTAPPGVPVGAAELSEEELRAGVEVAHQRSRKAAAHALAASGIKNAIRAGVDTVEHAALLDDEGIELALKHGTILVPTLAAYAQMVWHAGQGALNARLVKMATEVHEGHMRVIGRAYQAGVKIGVGSDAGSHFNPHDDIVTELELLARIGIPPAEVLYLAGPVSAEAMGWQDRIGSLEAGKLADVIAVSGNPLEDLGVLRTVDLEVKGGEVVVPLA